MQSQLEKDIRFLMENKNSISDRRLTTKKGITNFREVTTCFLLNLITNKLNRGENLDSAKSYKSKVHHLFRFIESMSGKPPLTMSIIKDRPHISQACIVDDGTMFSLFVDKHYKSETISYNEFKDICADIRENENYKDTLPTPFLDKIEYFVSNLTNEKAELPVSLENLIKESNLVEFYNDTEISYEIQIRAMKQHKQEQQNANKKENEWKSHDFHKSDAKEYDSLFENSFVGTKVLELCKNTPGMGICSSGKKSNTYKPFNFKESKEEKISIKKEKAEEILYRIKGFTDYVKALDSTKVMEKFSEWSYYNEENMSNSHYKFWTDVYSSLIKNSKYSDIQSFIENQFNSIYNCAKWKTLDETIDDQFQYVKAKTCSALSDCSPSKGDTCEIYAAAILDIVNKTYTRNVKKKTQEVANDFAENLIKLVIGNVIVDTVDDNDNPIKKSIEFHKAFGSESGVYQTTSLVARIKYLIIPAYKKTLEMHQKSLKGAKNHNSIKADKLNIITSAFKEANIQQFDLWLLSHDSQYKIPRLYNFLNSDGIELGHIIPDKIRPDLTFEPTNLFLQLNEDNHCPMYKERDNSDIWPTQKDYIISIINQNQSRINEVPYEYKDDIQMSIFILTKLIKHINN
jgi:hypothetical protein